MVHQNLHYSRQYQQHQQPNSKQATKRRRIVPFASTCTAYLVHRDLLLALGWTLLRAKEAVWDVPKSNTIASTDVVEDGAVVVVVKRTPSQLIRPTLAQVVR